MPYKDPVIQRAKNKEYLQKRIDNMSEEELKAFRAKRNGYTKKYRDAHADTINAKASEKTKCSGCGAIVRKSYLDKHKKISSYHNNIQQLLKQGYKFYED